MSENFVWNPDGISKRVPRIGDVAPIVEIYSIPEPGYELECVENNGETEWLRSFVAKDVELELVAG